VIGKWLDPGTVAVPLPNAQMVYVPSWQEFQEAAENLYEKSPNSVSPIHPRRPLTLADTTDADSLLCEMEIIRGEAGLEDHR
jgi:hypothetical protein